MLKRTLSAITAVVIGVSGLSADSVDKSVEVTMNPNGGAKKGVIVVPTGGDVYSENNAYVPVTESFAPEPVESIHATTIQVIEPAPSSRSFSDTIIYASGAKKSYMKKEPIKIKLKLKRKAYIYFWTVSASGRGYMILPNNFESFNSYRANRAYVVPEKSADYDFVSDRAGVEQVYVLATNKKINSSKIKSIFRKRAGGVVPTATNKDVRNFITKDIQVIARHQNLKYDIASFQIKVYDPRANQHSGASHSTVNITVNQ